MVATLFIRHVGDGGGDSCDGRGRREKKVVCVGEMRREGRWEMIDYIYIERGV